MTSRHDEHADPDDETARRHDGWRAGRPSRGRLSGKDAADPGQEEEGWVEGWLRERLFDGLFDEREPDDEAGA